MVSHFQVDLQIFSGVSFLEENIYISVLCRYASTTALAKKVTLAPVKYIRNVTINEQHKTNNFGKVE